MAAYLTYYAQMTGGTVASRLQVMEVRDTPLHRSFGAPSKSTVRQSLAHHGSCTTPVHLRQETYVDVDHTVRCRNCPSCLRARRFQWGVRGQYECMVADRTWFFTGTFAAQTHNYVESKEEVQRFLKRLRDRTRRRDGTSIRYLMLPELHKSGAIHYHGLIHTSVRCTERMVTAAWQAGYCWPSLVRSDQAAPIYVTKYATKDMLGADLGEDGRSRRPRILASRKPTYGDPVIIRDEKLVQELARANAKELHEIWQQNLKEAIKLHERKKKPRTTQRIALELQAAQALG